MSDPIWISRVAPLALVDADGGTIGSMKDAIARPSTGATPPVVAGFVAVVQRRNIFVHAARVASIDVAGVHLRGGTVDLRRFALRSGELRLIGDLTGRRLENEVVRDVSIRQVTSPHPGWEVASLGIGRPGLLRLRRPDRIVSWRELPELRSNDPIAGDVARVNALHPADGAEHLRSLPEERRHLLAEALEDTQLADLLEQMPEDEQVNIVEHLDVERAVHVLEEMEPDDAADLLQELPRAERDILFAAMDTDEAALLRRLLGYRGDTAGGIMTPEPVIVPSDATVAEILARLRDSELPPALAARVFVADPPTTTPTGQYRGTIGIQRLLREPPSVTAAECLDLQAPTFTPGDTEELVARTFARYDLLVVAVVDAANRLVGAVSVDDVLARIAPGDDE